MQDLNDTATLNRVLGAAGEQALQDDDAAVDALFALHDAKIARAREVLVQLCGRGTTQYASARIYTHFPFYVHIHIYILIFTLQFYFHQFLI